MHVRHHSLQFDSTNTNKGVWGGYYMYYYVKYEGSSVAGLGNIEDGDKMDDMLNKFEKSKVVNLTIIKGNAPIRLSKQGLQLV